MYTEGKGPGRRTTVYDWPAGVVCDDWVMRFVSVLPETRRKKVWCASLLSRHPPHMMPMLEYACVPRSVR